MCPLCFLVGTVGVYTCAPECTNHFGSKGSESGTRRGLVPDDGKAEKHGFRNAEPARRARSPWFSRGQRGGKAEKHARRKSEPASDARGAWFSRGQRGEMKLARGGFVPPLFFDRNGRGLHFEGVLRPLFSWITDVPPGIVFACAARLVFTPRRRRSRSGGAPAPCHAGQR